jgi:hypothetical protein
MKPQPKLYELYYVLPARVYSLHTKPTQFIVSCAHILRVILLCHIRTSLIVTKNFFHLVPRGKTISTTRVPFGNVRAL